MNPNDNMQLPPLNAPNGDANQQLPPQAPPPYNPPSTSYSTGQDWQAQAVYGATHPGYNPDDSSMRPIPQSAPTAPLVTDSPNMPGSNGTIPLPQAGSEEPQQPTAPPYIPPTSYTPPVRQQAPDYKTYSSMKKRRWPAVLLTLLIVGLLAGAAYTGYEAFFVNNDTPTATNTTKTPNPSPTPKPQPQPKPVPAVDIATLDAVTINPAADMAGFTAKSVGVASVKNYTDGTGKCNLQFGTLSAEALKGNTIQELVAPQLDALKKAGATVDGPTVIDDLVLKDATDSKVTYKMTTVKITFTNGKKHGTSYYSAAILKNGTRAFVSRSCVSADSIVDQAAFDIVNNKAKQLTVTKQL
ncbi:MAG TPA: hypothetical protein VLE73_02055 [Candidatus Saccharimonadales bacterium]|nr:hypothetical protein [Candidatus Saccharimonadales bacterium]